MSSAPCGFWLCDSDFMPLPQRALCQYMLQGISRKSRLEKDREDLCRNAFTMCHKCWALTWGVSCLSSNCCFFNHKVTKTCVCFPTLTKEKIDSHRYMGGKNVSVYKEKTLETQGPEFSLRGRRCEQIREKGMLPNLSAADVACWAELSFSWILGRSGTVDPRRAEKCGREAWQETERRDLFREPLCVMTEWQDSEVCVRWLYIQVI